MKNIKKILLLVFILTAANVIEAYSSIIVSFHIARHRDCKGFGFCKITIESEDIPVVRPIGNIGNAVADINTTGRLILKINKKTGLVPEAFNTYFSKGIFICEDDFPVPSEILKALNYSRPYIIKAGEYPITISGDIITIEF